MFDQPDLARPRCGHPGWQQCQGPVRLPDHQVFGASVALDTNNYDEFTASRMERISNPFLARQTPAVCRWFARQRQEPRRCGPRPRADRERPPVHCSCAPLTSSSASR